MTKYYKSKEISQEKTPILFRLERRHTLLEDGLDHSDGQRRVFRANSVGSCQGSGSPKKGSKPLSKLCMTDDTRSNCSLASTVVITESELSSSWLYKARKAKIDSEDEINTNGESGEENDIQPVALRDPKLKPIPVELKSRKKKISTCCCYLLVAITICIASLGIMAAVGGIIYLEVSAAYRDIMESHQTSEKTLVDTVEKAETNRLPYNILQQFKEETTKTVFNDEITSLKSEEMLPKRTKQHRLLHEPTGSDFRVDHKQLNVAEQSLNSSLNQISQDIEVTNQLSDKEFSEPENFSLDSSRESDRSLEKETKEPFSNLQIPLNKKSLNSFLRNLAEEVKAVSNEDLDELHTNVHDSLNDTVNEKLTQNFNISKTDSPPLSISQLAVDKESVDSFLRNLGVGFRAFSEETDFDGFEKEIAKDVPNDKTKAEDKFNGETESLIFSNNQDPLEKEKVIKRKLDDGNPTIAIDEGFDILYREDELETSGDTSDDNSEGNANSETNLFVKDLESKDSVNVVDEKVEEHLNIHKTDSSLENNSSETSENDIVDENEEELNIIETDSPLDDQNFKGRVVLNSSFPNLADEDDFVLNLPVVEAKPPMEFIKRFIDSQNKDLNRLAIGDMDHKFSGIEVLNNLQDADDTLPSPRQKTFTKETVRTSHNSDIGLERREYLNNLRRKFYI